MKVAVVFVLFFATALCRPAKKVSDSSSESSEELMRQPAPDIQAAAEPAQSIMATAASSDESTESSDEDEQTPAQTTSASDTASDSDDSDSDDDDDDEAEEADTDEDGSSNSSESGESSTAASTITTPIIVTEESVIETTVAPIEPTIVTDTDTARGDSLGGYPGDYKSIVYVEDKSYHKVPAPYKSYGLFATGKKIAYDMTVDNEVEKSLHVYKAQVHSDTLEEDTSTPELENQGLDGISQDQDLTPRQASLPDKTASTGDTTTSESESSSVPQEEEEDESASSLSDSVSTSQESGDKNTQSSEEATASPGASDSNSDESDSNESDSNEQGAGHDTTTGMPVVITAK